MSTVLPRVLVTRAAEDAGSLSHALNTAGFQAVEVPALMRRWLPDATTELARDTEKADWLIVTSATTAEVIAASAPEAWPHAFVAAVGPATERRLRTLGMPVDLVPRTSTAEALVEALGKVEGLQIVYPHADLASSATAALLKKAGADVRTGAIYTNVCPPQFSSNLANALPVAATTVLSGSAARRLAEAVPADQRWRLGRVVVIGPSTYAVCQEVGLAAHAMANPHSVAGLIEAIQGLFV